MSPSSSFIQLCILNHALFVIENLHLNFIFRISLAVVRYTESDCLLFRFANAVSDNTISELVQSVGPLEPNLKLVFADDVRSKRIIGSDATWIRFMMTLRAFVNRHMRHGFEIELVQYILWNAMHLVRFIWIRRLCTGSMRIHSSEHEDGHRNCEEVNIQRRFTRY